MTNEFAIERLRLFVKHYDGENKEVFEKAIEALEKQIPKKPKDKGGYMKCGGCGNHIDHSYTDFYGTGDEVKFNYCARCGQAVDWSGGND